MLRPVLEFDPFEYRASRPAPKLPLAEDPAAWAAFWRDSLADAGIAGVEPFPDTWVVPIEDVCDPELLERVVANHLGEADVATFLQTLVGPFDPKSGMNADGERIVDGITALRGGLALTLGDDVRIAPECCGDLSNWRDWLNATRVTTETWQDVWIGHPTARVRWGAGLLEVQAVLESGEPTGSRTRFRAEDLRQAVEVARDRLHDLQRRLLPILAPGVRAASVTPAGSDTTPLVEGLATHLAGLADFHLD